jgi:modulator of FtsH protease HflC
MQNRVFGTIALLFVGLIALLSSVFVISETDQVVVLRLGKETRVINTPERPAPGLAFKIPFLETVMRFDKRALNLDMDTQEVLATDKQRLRVDAFARFRIVDPLQTYRSAGTEDNARTQLKDILGSRLRDELGTQPYAALLSAERGKMMDVIQESVNLEAKKYGAEIIDVRIKRADLPAGDPLNAALQRMKTEREQEARRIRAQGQKLGQDIRAGADVEAAKIYADSFNRDADFYAFYRSMLAYQRTLKKEDTTVILSPDSAFMEPFKSAR